MSILKLSTLSTFCLSIVLIFACSDEKSRAKAETNSSSKEEVFTIVEEQPSYEGGMAAFYKYAQNEIRYPAAAREAGLEGLVLVEFVIERNGSISDLRILTDIGGGCGQEARRIVEAAAPFKAGSQRGRTVRTRMVLPITFKINKNKTNPDLTNQGSVIIEEIKIKKSHFELDVAHQNGAWEGTVKDETGKPLPGTNFFVEGTTYGRVSGLDGTFKVLASEDQKVRVSFVGYETVYLEE